MFTAFSRIIKNGFVGFWRNGWLSTATISILVMALVVFESLIIFRVLTETALTSIEDKIDISVYFKTDVPEDEILRVQKAIESMAEVKEVQYISKDDALAAFQAKHKDDPTVTQSLQELQSNPLLASFNIKAHNPNQYSTIADYLNKASFNADFSKISYAQNQVVIDRLTKIINTAESGGLVLIAVLAAIGVLVTFNTIRLAIYSSREEIEIMRLVGASNPFIRGPYLVQGIIYGFIAAVMSVLVAAPFVYLASPYVKIFIPEIDLWPYFVSHAFLLFSYQLLFGVILGFISSYIAVRKYLRI